MRRHGRDREFGDVAVLRHRPGHPAQAEACAQAIDEMRQLRAVVGCREAGLHRIAALGRKRRQPHHIEAETGIAGLSERGEPLAEQRPDAPRIAQRRAGPDLAAINLAVGAEQRDLQPAGAFAAPLQHAGELVRQLLGGAEHVGFEQDRIGEAAFRHIGRNRQAGRDRLVLPPQGLIDAADEFLAEARRERSARPIDHVGNMLETGLPQGGRDVGRDAQRREPQRQQCIAGAAGRHDGVHYLPSLQGRVEMSAPPPRRSRRCRRWRCAPQNLAARAAARCRRRRPPRRRTDARNP